MERADGVNDEETDVSVQIGDIPQTSASGQRGSEAADKTRGSTEMEEAAAAAVGVALQEEERTSSAPPSSELLVVRYLYIGHFLARWGARMWEFSVGLYFINLWPNSLLFAAIYGAVESASIALFGAVIGRWVDNLTYIKVLRLWLLTQNFSFLIAGSTVVELLVHPNLKMNHFNTFVLLVVLVNLSGAVGVLSALAGTILIEREWVVVISEGQPPETLTQMNSVIRRIDLICKLLAPVLSGFIISFASLKASAAALASWNLVSLWLQYWLLISVYSGIPSLRQSNHPREMRIPQGEILSDEGNGSNNNSTSSKISRFLKTPFVSSWKVYIEQEVVLPGVSLALLFFTVLGFGTLMTATLKWEGIPAYVIGIARGVSATIGILATVLYPLLQARISTLRTGFWSIWSQWIFLSLCVASIWIQKRWISALMLMGGVATSRLGLWMFDLSITQLMQDSVPESDRGAVGGAQNSLQSTLDLLANVMGIIISNPQDFWKLTLLSFMAVTLAAVLYTVHVFRVRKNFVHVTKLLALIRCSTEST